MLAFDILKSKPFISRVDIVFPKIVSDDVILLVITFKPVILQEYNCSTYPRLVYNVQVFRLEHEIVSSHFKLHAVNNLELKEFVVILSPTILMVRMLLLDMLLILEFCDVIFDEKILLVHMFDKVRLFAFILMTDI
jgi:hypothetical protein